MCTADDIAKVAWPSYLIVTSYQMTYSSILKREKCNCFEIQFLIEKCYVHALSMPIFEKKLVDKFCVTEFCLYIVVVPLHFE